MTNTAIQINVYANISLEIAQKSVGIIIDKLLTEFLNRIN